MTHITNNESGITLHHNGDKYSFLSMERANIAKNDLEFLEYKRNKLNPDRYKELVRKAVVSYEGLKTELILKLIRL